MRCITCGPGKDATKILLFRKTLTVCFYMYNINYIQSMAFEEEILRYLDSNQYFNKLIIISNEIIYTNK